MSPQWLSLYLSYVSSYKFKQNYFAILFKFNKINKLKKQQNTYNEFNQ